jgi:uncharacterized membrane protein YgdD (TMEM256/DUF423 family)
MTSQTLARRNLLLGAILLALAVLIGAFGAHGLKSMVEAEKLVTFETGVRYHFFHAFGLMILGLIQNQYPTLNTNTSFWAFCAGILLFSFNCYFYVLSGIKIFAIIVPVGGLLFILGWVVLSWKLLKLR